SRRRHTRSKRDWSSDVCSSDLRPPTSPAAPDPRPETPTMSAQESLPPTDALQQQPAPPLAALHYPDVMPAAPDIALPPNSTVGRSEERRVGKECRSRWGRYHES